METGADVENRLDGLPLVAQVLDPGEAGGVPGKCRNRTLIIDHMHRNAAPPQAADNAEAGVIASDDERPSFGNPAWIRYVRQDCNITRRHFPSLPFALGSLTQTP